jgi:hypothetical protein
MSSVTPAQVYQCRGRTMAHDFVPRRDVDFVHFSADFSAQINATPAAFGLTPAMASDYAALNDTLQNAYAIATAPNTRTGPNIQAKNKARQNAERELRRLARLIQATPGVSDAQKFGLGLTVRDTEPSLIPRPVERPRVSVELLYGSTVRITLRGQDSTRRGKPQDVAGATVFSYVGTTPPTDPGNSSLWMQTNTTRPRFVMTFQQVEPGAKVWIAARWFNPRQQTGPVCQPVYTHVQCPTLLFNSEPLRLAG